MIVDFLASTQGIGVAGNINPSIAMEDHPNSQKHTMHQQLQLLQQQQQQQQQNLQSGGIDQQQRFDGSLDNFGANTSTSLFQSQLQQQNQQQQNRHSPDLSNQSHNGGVQNTNSINISNEIKRLQQLHQLGVAGMGSSNALLMNPGSGSLDPATSAFLQSMFAGGDTQQKVNFNTNNRFEHQLAGNLISNSTNNNNSATQTQSNVPANSSMPIQLPSNFLNDARLLMAQNQIFQQNQGMQFAMMPQHQELQEQALGGTSQEMPLPSPHSLFHRDGSRRMRGGVIEPFPGMCCAVWPP